MQPPAARAKITSEAMGRLRVAVENRRRRIIQALNAILEDLPREAAGYLDAQSPPDSPNCFLWPREFLDGETLWRLDVIVSKDGWPGMQPTVYWVVAFRARD